MPIESHYFNLTTGKWVRSFAQPAAVSIPTFGYGDTRDFGVTFVRQTSVGAVEVVQSVVSAQIGLSTPSAPGTILTSATAGAASNNEFPFVLLISGSGMATYMSGKTDPQRVLVEFRIASAGGVNRYGTEAWIRPQQISDTTADPAATDRALGANEAAGIYLAKQVPTGARMIWVDEATGQTYSVGFANGQFQANLL